ncbi:hypothetical protein C2S51_030124 [Perilla frutescens var. frutescens]|nr:hypothetical protein C2S51_030124 [Perilla frutescens var. frutescens]
MTSLERIRLEDLQELAESFANMKMVDLKMNTGDRALIPRGYHQDFHVGDQHRRERPNMNNLTGTRVRKQIPKFRDTPLGRTSLDPIHPYGLMLNIDDIDFNDIDMIIDDWSSSMRIAAGMLDLEKEGFIKLLEMSLLGVAKTFRKEEDYSQAILNLRLNNMEKESIDQFFKLYHIYQWNSDVDERSMICQPSLEENLKGHGRTRNTEFILMPKKNSQEKEPGNGGADGPGKRPDFTKLDKEGVLLETGHHKVHQVELLQEKLSEEPIRGKMKVLKIATTGLAIVRKREESKASKVHQTSRKQFTIKNWYKSTNLRIYPQMRVYTKKKKYLATKVLMGDQTLNQTGAEVFHQEQVDETGYSSQTTISQSMIDKIMNKSLNIQRYQGFSAGKIDQLLRNFSLKNRKHNVIYKITRREMSLPIELTGNQVELQLIPYSEVQEELGRMRPEIKDTISWIHIGAIQIVLKSALPAGVDTPIDIAICHKRIRNNRDSLLGTISGNLCAKQIIGVIYPKISYNLKDRDFSRALTLYQDFKRKDISYEGNRPFFLTYQVSYALSNSHHIYLFMGKQFIEIPDVFSKVA